MSKKKHKRGDVREDGYIFMRYIKHANGKTYECWTSPLALNHARKRNAEWREANKERALQARRDWFQKNKDHHYAYQKTWRIKKKSQID